MTVSARIALVTGCMQGMLLHDAQAAAKAKALVETMEAMGQLQQQ